MYACIRRIGCGFFEGVCRLENRPLTFRDPPPHHTALREWFYASTHCESGGYRCSDDSSLLRYLVPGDNPQDEV
jgi:hypothetical protein